MKQFLLSLICGLLVSSFAIAQLNITEVSNLDYAKDLSDVWGWDDGSGKEYALVGVYDGFSVVDITTVTDPVEIFFEPGNNSIWRDIKTWNNHAYVTTEGGGGLLIVDLAALPADTNLVYYTGSNYPFQSAHNLYIDENGIGYIFGADYANGGVIMLDLTQDPLAPVEIGLFDTYYVHDGVVRGDTLWASCIDDGIQATVNVSDKANPVLLATWATPSDFAHNCWFSDDGKYLFTTDEKEYAYIASYDVSDLGNVIELDRWQSNPGTGTIPHNTHYINGYLVTSYYNDGITINDVSDPSMIIEVGNYDTSPLLAGNDAGGFHGSWGAYPWLPSGVILAADIENGLFVLQPDYKRAAYLKGLVLEEGTSTLISGANIEIIGYGNLDATNNAGEYATGIPEGGTVQVVFSALGYYSDTVSLTLTQASVLNYDALLVAKPKTDLSGVVKLPSWVNLDAGMVKISNEDYNYSATSNAQGYFNISDVYADTYTVLAGKWGYKTTQEDNVVINENSGLLLTFVEDGYYDDFTFDFGWTVSGNATAGIWERAIPNGTDYQGAASNADADVIDDIDDYAFITGNNGTNAGDDDIDDGNTVLRSPDMDLSAYGEPYVRFHTWFFNGGGFGGAPNDSLNIYLSNGTDTVMLVSQNLTSNMSEWVFHNYKISDYIGISSTMYLIVEAMDVPDGHIVEAGFDHFRITEGPSGVNTLVTENGTVEVYPNPFRTSVYVNVGKLLGAKVQVTDITGRIIHEEVLRFNQQQIEVAGDQGVYILSVIHEGNIVATEKLMKY